MEHSLTSRVILWMMGRTGWIVPLAVVAGVGLGVPAHADDRVSSWAPTPPPSPATRAAERVLGVLERVRTTLRTTRYQHPTRVRERQGLYAWDCSGMAAWVLARSAPRALGAIARPRPVARDFYRVIERAPVGRARRGWQRLAHIADARPGDLFAWLRPRDWPPRNTGHVGFVVDSPRPVAGLLNAYEVRIVDATSVPHRSDTRTWPGDGGFGIGTIMFTTDGHGQALAYGWFGARSPGVVPTRVLFGRVTR